MSHGLPLQSPAIRFVLMLSLGLGAAAVAGCVTTPKRKTAAKAKPLTEKPEDRPDGSGATGAAAAGTEPAKDAPPMPPGLEVQWSFVRTHLSGNGAFGAAEHAFVDSLPARPPAGSISEAALALGLLRATLNPVLGAPTAFKEADLAAGAAAGAAASPTAAKPGSLESRCRERGLNLADALAENPLLAHPGVARQTLAALDLGGDSEEFRVEITSIVRRQIDQWSALATRFAPATAPSAASAGTTAPEPAVSDDSAPPNPADLAGGDTALAEAQALADRGDFKGAIRRASVIQEGSPLATTAQERIRDYSNRAVQDLRRKAGEAFQSSMPVSDPKKRAEFLKRAKGYLEEALKDYPTAAQLPTVRDNLQFITRDLEKIEEEMGKGH